MTFFSPAVSNAVEKLKRKYRKLTEDPRIMSLAIDETANACRREDATQELGIGGVILKCRFGCNNPIGIFSTPEGCVCWPDPVQALCAQHAQKGEQNVDEFYLIVRLPL